LQDTEKSDWILYVRNLNDRHLNRRTSSGFQAWTILAFTGFCVSRVLQLIPHMMADTEFRSDLLVVTSLELYAVAVVLLPLLAGPLTNGYPSHRQSNHVRVVTPLSSAQKEIRGWGLCAVSILWLALAVVTAANTRPRWLPDVFCLMSSMGLWQSVLWIVGSRWRSVLEPLNVNPWTMLGKGLRNWLCCVATVVAAIAWVFAYRSATVTSLEKDGINLLTAGSAFIGILFGLFILSLVLADSLRDSWLEEFETTVLLEDLPAEKIRDGLILGYLGQDLTASLERLKASADDASGHCVSAVEAATKGYVYTATLEPASPNFSGQLNGSFEFMSRLPTVLATSVMPAISELERVADAMRSFIDTGESSFTREIWVQFEGTLNTTLEAMQQLQNLVRSNLRGMISDFAETAAKAHRGKEAREIIEKVEALL